MSISCDKIFVQVSRYLSLWPWHLWNWPLLGAFVFHKYILFVFEAFSKTKKMPAFNTKVSPFKKPLSTSASLRSTMFYERWKFQLLPTCTWVQSTIDYVSFTQRKTTTWSFIYFIWRELAVAYKKYGIPYQIGQTHSNTSHNTTHVSIINVHIHNDHHGLTTDRYLFK